MSAVPRAPVHAGFVVMVTDADGESVELNIAAETAVIGKGRDCLVPLAGWRIGREHARIVRTPQGLMLEDLGQFSGTWVNGSRVVRHGPLGFADQIQIASYKLRVQEAAAHGLGGHPGHAGGHAGAAGPSAAGAYARASTGAGAGGGAAGHPGVQGIHGQPGGAPTERAQGARADVPAGLPAAALSAPVPVNGGVTAAPAGAAAVAAHPAGAGAERNTLRSHTQSAEVLRVQARHPWRKHVHEQLLETIDLRRRDLSRMSDAELRVDTERLVREIVDELKDLPEGLDREALIQEVLHEAIGLGPLEELLADESVTEIMVNKADEIFVERRGQLQWYPLAFTSDRAIMGVIERIVAPLGRRIDESSPLVDARLKDGSRVNAIIPPLALKGPTLTIRKFSKKRLGTNDMVAYGSLNQSMVDFLQLCVEHRKNMIVSGGTGSGKTTFLNVLSNFIPDGERIITIEDAAELKLNHSHLVSLESRPTNVEGRGAVTIRDLVKNSLRMRPDRIVVGECRGGEALDMLQAMNTGHEGSMTTLHANTPRDAMARLETLILMAGMDLPINAIREQIASAVDVVVQQTRFACGSRKVTSITEITGMENGRIQMQEIFRFQQRGYGENGKVMGYFTGCEAVPSFYDELREQGAEVDLGIFERSNG